MDTEKRAYLSILLALAIMTATGQELSYARYDVRDGLAGSVVYQGVQDNEGFLWFGTETGVSRFDGTHFVNFTTADGLPDNEILRVFVDSKNRVWIMPFRNSICYYYKGKIYNQVNSPVLKNLRFKAAILGVAEDRLGNIYVADANVIYQLNTSISESKLVFSSHAPFAYIGIRYNGNVGIAHNSDGYHAVITEFDPATQRVTSKGLPYDVSHIQRTLITPSIEVWHKKDSLFLVNVSSQTTLPVFDFGRAKGISRLNDSLLSINTAHGARIFNYRTGVESRYELKNEVVNSVLIDREGNFWFMTNGKGVYRAGSFEFRNFTFNESPGGYLSVYSLNKTNNILQVGTENGIVWKINQNNDKQPLYLSGKRAEIYDRVRAIASLNNKTYYASDKSFLKEENGVMKHANMGTATKSMVSYKNKLLLAGADATYWVDSTLTFRHSNVIYFARATAAGVFRDTIYIDSNDGLHKVLNKDSSLFLGDRFPILNSRITAMGTLADSILWIATNGNGLIGFSDNKITHIITQKDGLTSDICRALYITPDYLWLGTDKGLNRIQLAGDSCKVTNYTVEDGLIANIVNCVYVEGSKVYVGTQAGLTAFDADKISRNTTCHLQMTGIQVGGQEWTYDTTAFILPPKNNAIRFDYAGISYRSAGDITYRYRLTGLNDGWQTTRETYLSYPSLPSGEYELQLIAINKYGVESQLLRIPFKVDKFYWETTWFRLLTAIIFAGFVWIFVHARILKIRKQNDEKMQINNRMADLEQMALKAQMNPHFIFNSLNSVQQYVIDKDILGANKFITEFSRLIRLTLDISSKSKITLYEEMSYLTTYLELEKTKFEGKFTYSVKAAADVDTDSWYIPPMILQPYVENSIRHGVRNRLDNKGHVAITFYTEGNYLVCCVEDNGVGRQKASQYKSELAIEYQSKGMTLTARRIEMLNRNNTNQVSIHIEDLETNNQPAGTRVTLKFPMEEAGRP